jgi:biotin-dependent carboxylase-like uncharacterized protein
LGILKALDIIAPGPLTTVQDLGRTGYGAYGVPPSGALDSFSLRMGNLLVGNPEDAAGLEITLMGLQTRARCDMVVAVTGGDLQPVINNIPIEMGAAVLIKSGDRIVFKMARTGCRAYLAMGGGIHVERVMDSRSTNLGSGFGGLNGRALKKGDVLFSADPQHHLKWAGQRMDASLMPEYSRRWSVRIVWGPQDRDFSQKTREAFLNTSFTVTSESDRTGIRLKGPALPAREGLPTSIISEGIIPGAVQVPGSGQPIILLGETVTGGYRKIATVISVDLPLLGQIRPEDTVTFEAVSLETAYAALWEREARISAFKAKIMQKNPTDE